MTQPITPDTWRLVRGHGVVWRPRFLQLALVKRSPLFSSTLRSGPWLKYSRSGVGGLNVGVCVSVCLERLKLCFLSLSPSLSLPPSLPVEDLALSCYVTTEMVRVNLSQPTCLSNSSDGVQCS